MVQPQFKASAYKFANLAWGAYEKQKHWETKLALKEYASRVRSSFSKTEKQNQLQKHRQQAVRMEDLIHQQLMGWRLVHHEHLCCLVAVCSRCSPADLYPSRVAGVLMRAHILLPHRCGEHSFQCQIDVTKTFSSRNPEPHACLCSSSELLPPGRQESPSTVISTSVDIWLHKPP